MWHRTMLGVRAVPVLQVGFDECDECAAQCAARIRRNESVRHRRLGFVPPDVGFVPTDVGCTPVLLPRSSRLESLWSEQKELKELKGFVELF